MPAFQDLKDLLHGIVDRIRWTQESDRDSAHDVIEESAPLLGRNAVPAGVQEPSTPEASTPATADSFPTTPASE